MRKVEFQRRAGYQMPREEKLFWVKGGILNSVKYYRKIKNEKN